MPEQITFSVASLWRELKKDDASGRGDFRVCLFSDGEGNVIYDKFMLAQDEKRKEFYLIPVGNGRVE